MDFESFISGPILEIVLLFFMVGLIFRIVFSIISTFKSDKYHQLKGRHIFSTIGRSLLPFHKAATKKPVYTLLRYIYHLCMIIVPVFLSGHIVLWESSWLELSWPAIPDDLADWLTIIFIVLSILFIFRRILLKKFRHDSTGVDYILLAIGAITFSSGYFLAHGTLDSIDFLTEHMLTIHILSAEVMIIMAVFLFLRSRLDKKKCTGCAACELNCPSGTLNARENDELRIFSYSHYQCICCGACIVSCPEQAASLKHNINVKRFFQISKKQEIIAVKLKKCHKCGRLFAPIPQLDKLSEMVADDFINFCPSCKMINSADNLHRLIPWHKK